jgi:hypothetical protein
VKIALSPEHIVLAVAFEFIAAEGIGVTVTEIGVEVAKHP